MMAHIFDVAKYILQKSGSISTWKLQKLVFYSQAWHAVWEDSPLFNAHFEAWANGPVSPLLYEQHKGSFTINDINNGDINKLTDGERESIDRVIEFYGKFNGQQLSDFTHSEAPWQNARRGLAPNERSNTEITVESMAEFYGSL